VRAGGGPKTVLEAKDIQELAKLAAAGST
jgi:hypothetical protein